MPVPTGVSRPARPATADPAGRDPFLRNIVGASPKMQRIFRLVTKVAPTDSSVLLLGESGTGKELIARSIHLQSRRAAGPFVAVNVGALPESLIESELFGYVRGAFTGAASEREGLVESADGGTLFLDEIGDMPPTTQVKLLRTLESSELRRLGDNHLRVVDIRVIAATHRDLPKAVAEGRFREDLYFRLNVVPIVVPPLRDRPEDVPLMAEHFIAQFCRELGRPAARLHPDALRVMLDYAWPGNVRELRNLMERVVLLEAEDEIRVEHLPPEVTGARGGARTHASAENVFPPGVVRPLAEVEKLAIEHALSVCGGNKTLAAKQLGISRQTLRTKLKEYALGDDPDEAGEGILGD